MAALLTLTRTLCHTQAVKDFKGGKVEYRLDRSGSLHVLCGRCDFPDDKLLDNMKAIQVCNCIRYISYFSK